jgi:hypothetical protein
MEGTGSRLDEFAACHPEVSALCCVEGTWHAWISTGEFTGAEAHGRTEDELLAKLAAALPG